MTFQTSPQPTPVLFPVFGADLSRRLWFLFIYFFLYLFGAESDERTPPVSELLVTQQVPHICCTALMFSTLPRSPVAVCEACLA